jgi:hypothetical protein
LSGEAAEAPSWKRFGNASVHGQRNQAESSLPAEPEDALVFWQPSRRSPKLQRDAVPKR